MTIAPGTSFEVTTDPEEITGGPGDVVRVTVTVHNRGDQADTFALRWLGVDSPPCSIGPVQAQAQESVACELEIPFDRQPAERGIGVEITANSGQSSLVRLTLLTGTSDRLAVVVRPKAVRARRRGRFELEVTNRGTVAATVEVDGGEPGIRVQLKPGQLVLAPGATTVFRGRVQARVFAWGDSRNKVVPLWISSGGTPIYETVGFHQRGIIPVAARKAVALVGVLAVWAVLLTTIVNVAKHSGSPADTANDASPSDVLARGDEGQGSEAAAAVGATPAGGEGSVANGAGKAPKKAAANEAAAKGVEISGLIKLASAGPEGVNVTLKPVDLDGGAPDRPKAKPAAASAPARPSELAAGSPALGKAWSETTPSPTGPLTDVRGTVSNTDGEWGFAGIPAPGLYELVFAKAGFDTRSYLVTAEAAKPVHFDVELAPGRGAVGGQVRGPSGALGAVDVTITDGTIVYRTSTAGGSSGESQPTGAWSMDGLGTPARYTVTFTRRGYGTETLAAELSAGSTLSGLSVLLTPGVGSVSGMVKSGGEPLGGATVTVSDGLIERSTNTLTDSAKGSYLLPQLPLNKVYTVTVSKAGYLPQTLTINLADNSPGIDVDLRRSTAMVYGKITDSATGAGIGGVGIRLTNGASTFKSTTTVSPPGTFELSGLPPGTYVVEFARFEYEPSSSLVTVVGGDRTALTIALNPRPEVVLPNDAQITGLITDSRTGSGLAGATVRVLGHPKRADGSLAEARTSADGRYAISNLGLGTWIVEVSGPANPKFQAITRTVRLGATTAEILDATLLPLGALTGKVTDTAGGPIANASVTIDELAGVSLPTDGNGIYKSGTDLRTGTYHVRFSAPGFQELAREISIVVGNTATLDVSLYQWPHVVGRVLQPKGDPVSFVALANTIVTLHKTAGEPAAVDVAVETNAAGEFAVPTTATSPGQWDITAALKQPAAGAAPSLQFASATASRQLNLEQGQSIDLVLSPQLAVGGQVSWVDVNNIRHEVAAPQVSTDSILTGYIPSLTSAGQNPVTASRQTVGDTNGRWLIVGQVGGTSIYRAAATNFVDSAPLNVKVVPPNEPAAVNFELEPLPRALSGQVVPKPGGTPDGFQVTITAPGVNRVLPAPTAADGSFGASGLRPGTYDVTFKKAGFKDNVIKATVPLGADLALGAVKLDQLATLEVRVLSGLDQSILNGASVELFAPGAAVATATATTANGQASFPNLLPDATVAYAVTVTVAHHHPARATVLVSAFGQAASLDVVPDRLGQIVGNATTDTVGVSTSFDNKTVDVTGPITASGNGSTWTVPTDVDGKFRLDDLEPGQYRIALKLAGYQQTAPNQDIDVKLNVVTQPLAKVERLGALVGHVATDNRAVRADAARVEVIARNSAGAVFKATTDDSGNYRIATLAAGPYNLSVQAVGHERTTATGDVVLNQDTATNLVLQRLGDLVVEVLDARDAKPVTGATVKATLLSTEYALTESIALPGTYRVSAVPSGVYKVKVTGPGYASPATSPTQEVKLNEDAKLQVTIDHLGALTGTVNQQNRGVRTKAAGVKVTAQSNDGTKFTADTDAAGVYRITDLAPGTYTLQAAATTGYVQNPAVSSATVSFNTEETADLVVTRLSTVTVNVTRGTSTTPVSDVVVVATSAAAPTVTMMAGPAAGSYVLAGLAGQSLTFDLSKAGFASIQNFGPVTVVLDEDKVVAIPLDELAVVKGTVQLLAGTVKTAAPKDVDVTATPADGSPAINVKTDSNGDYRIPNLKPGVYALSSTLSGYLQSSGPVDVTAEYNVERITDLTVVQLGFVTGQVEKVTSGTAAPLGGVKITATADNPAKTKYEATANAAGIYRISGLANGTYFITVTLTGYGQTTPTAAVAVSLNTETKADVSLTAAPGRVFGTVESDSNNSPIDGVVVTASYSIGGTPTNVSCTTPCGGTAGSGSFTIDNLQPTSITLTFTYAGHKDLTRTVAALNPAQALNVGTVTLLSNRAAIAGSVSWLPVGFGSDQGPVADAVVSLTEVVTTGTAATFAPQTTTVAGLGKFNFVGLGKGSYRLSVTHTDFQAYTPITVSADGVNTETRNIVLTPKTRTVTVEVASSRGTAIAGATVSLSRGGSTTPITAPTTNSLGITQFTAVNPGPQNLTDTPYRLTVSASNHAPLTAKAIIVDLAGDTKLSVTLSATATVKVPVTFDPVRSQAKANVELWLKAGTTKTFGPTACSATCTFAGVPAGIYVVKYLAPTLALDYVVPDPEEITVTDTEDETAASVVYEKKASVRVVITSPSSSVASVTISPQPPDATTSDFASAVTVLLLAHTTYTFTVDRAPNDHQAFSTSAQFAPGARVDQAINVLGEGKLEVTVKNSTNQAVESANVRATATAAGSLAVDVAWNATSTAYVLEGLPAGDYDVAVSGVTNHQDKTIRATITTGKTTKSVSLDLVQVTVTGTVKSDGLVVAGVQVSLGAKSTTSDSKGIYSFTAVSVGTYSLAAGAFGSCPAATKSVGVTAAATTFDLAVDTTLSVTVKLDGDKSLTAATLTFADGATALTPTATAESTGVYSVTGIAGTAAFVVTATVTAASGDLTASSTSQAVTACKTLSPVTLFVK